MPCEAAGQELDVSDEDLGDGGFDGPFEVLGEPAVASQPCEGALHDPAARDDFQALRCIQSLHDFDGPFSDFGQSPKPSSLCRKGRP